MSAEVAATRSLEERLTTISSQRLDDAKKTQLLQLCRDADGLARRDGSSGKLYLDEQALRGFLREHADGVVPDGFVDRLKGLPNGELIRGGLSAAGSDQPLRLEDFVLGVTGEAPADSFKELGLRPDATVQELRGAVEQRIGRIPDRLFDPASGTATITSGLRALGTDREGHDATAGLLPVDTDAFWECVIEAIGFWAVVALALAIMAMIASVLTGGGFAVVLAVGMETFFRIWGVASLCNAVLCFLNHILLKILA